MTRVMSYAEHHLPGVLALCVAEGWPSLPADTERAQRILSTPRGSAVVALDNEEVIGFAFAIVDGGALDAYLSLLVVAKPHRREGVARLLIAEIFRNTKVERLDLLAEPGSEPFYDTLAHRRFAGYRLYPESD
jgi:GNAT superfamily N-acetyltransferase